MTWEQWRRKYQRVVGSDDHGFELLFARTVLPRVPGLTPEEVTPQYTENVGGRRRRIDFAIQREGIKLAVEIDGWDKSGTGQGMSRHQHQDFLSRQNDLVLAGWTFLRFTPVEVRDHPAEVARRLSKALDKPSPSSARPPRRPPRDRAAAPEPERRRSEKGVQVAHRSRQYQGALPTSHGEPPPVPPAAATVASPVARPPHQPSNGRSHRVSMVVGVVIALMSLMALMAAIFGATGTTAGGNGESVAYTDCSEARAAGAAPIHRGEPGYANNLDRDSDGLACE